MGIFFNGGIGAAGQPRGMVNSGDSIIPAVAAGNPVSSQADGHGMPREVVSKRGSMVPENYFGAPAAARRYRIGRPYFHPQVIRRIQARLNLAGPLPCALDVGCGTGLSTAALAKIARTVIGIDVSAPMIAQAPADADIRYCISAAENIPFREAAFDLITLGSVFHWLDQARFLPEARRVLCRDGWLILYGNFFTACMVDNDDFLIWYEQVYLEEFPNPPHHRADLGGEEASRAGLRLLEPERFQNTVVFPLRGLIDYLMTQSNIIAAVEFGGRDAGEVTHWLEANLRPFFGQRNESAFRFGAEIFYLQKSG
jgi:SAM-dependent methyltransferase